MAGELTKAVADLQEEKAVKMINDRLATGEDANKLFNESREGMELVGERFGKGEYFLPELVYSAEIFKQIAEILKPKLKTETKAGKAGKVIVGTVAGDIHDIGKDIVVFMLDMNGFEVYDLGVDVPPQKFIDKIKETDASIVALSGFLTLAFDSMKQTVDAIKAAGLRNKVKIMVGGGQIDDEIRKFSGADAYGKDAMAGVSIAKGWA
ncbi:MAG: cobalamin B12-binding domain-containing protein [Chloroflexi bacterium]|nr:cobalamin B12-binding domain-containing protein [Chloroflexota bacterium]